MGNGAVNVMRKTPRMMSKRERKNYLLQELKIPGYLIKHIERQDSQVKKDFLSEFVGMVEGRQAVDLDRLRSMIDEIDRARYRTPERRSADEI